MPGKINPSIPEMVNQVCFQVMGCDTTVAIASEHGQLELSRFTRDGNRLIAAHHLEADLIHHLGNRRINLAGHDG
ncbi:MAG TPA: hypothetical protein VKP00_00495 [Gemmatimonadaceae bacterium]|nr:hypothetical protein [Gemmatimonadaceae bacterium]